MTKNKGSNDQCEGHRAARFNFVSDDETGTIGELLDDIDVQTKEERTVTFESLKNTLEFIKKVTGVSIKDNKKPIPLTTLKVIKLLFIKNSDSEKHLFGQLELPRDEDATMEHSTSTTISRDPASAKIINSIVGALALEIPKENLTLLSQMLGNSVEHSSSEKILLYIERASDDVGRILNDRFKDDVLGLANAYHALAKDVPTESPLIA